MGLRGGLHSLRRGRQQGRAGKGQSKEPSHEMEQSGRGGLYDVGTVVVVPLQRRLSNVGFPIRYSACEIAWDR